MRKLLALVFSAALLAISIVALLSVTRSITTPANAAPNPIEIISISELSSTSVEILFSSSVPKKSLSYFVINAAADSSIGMPKNIKKTIKTKASGLITTEIKNLNPKASYKFTVSAKTNKAKMINSAAVEYSSLSILMDALSNLPSDWGNPKPIQIPIAAPAAAPVVLPAFTLTSSTETRTVNTVATGFTTNSTGSVITSFAINATPSNMSFNTTTGALTGTPNTIAAATTYTITATNSSGSATQTFTLTVTVGAALKVAVTQASVGTSPGIAFTTQPQITIQDLGGNTITSSTAVVTATVSTGGTLVGAATATASSGVATFSNLGIRGFGATAYTITYTVTGLTTATQSVTPSALIVGNTGPGGGKIFYVAATSAGFDCGPTTTEKCYYLEAAPTSGTAAWTDGPYVWSGNMATATGATAQAIGTGYANTLAIVGQSGGGNTAARAGTISRAHRGPSNLSDWFLPSQDELLELYLRRETVGGFGTNVFWSSSEVDPFDARYRSFPDGNSFPRGKGFSYFVRPIRSF